MSFNCDNIASSELVDQALEKAFNDIMKVAEDGMKNISEVFPEATPIISDGKLFNHIVAKAKEREEECASILLQIGIAVWTPDEATPGNYLLSQFFGESFKDTIHLVSHTEDLDVSTQRSTRYINFLVCKH